MSPTRVLIADDHQIVREGLCRLLDGEFDLEVIGQAEEGLQAINLARELQPDVVILDIAMPQVGGLVALPLLRQLLPETRIIIFSMYEKESYAEEVRKAGAHGYVLKGGPSDEIITAIRRVMSGRTYYKPASEPDPAAGSVKTKGPCARHLFHDLSTREKEIFFLVIKGNSTPEIADLLCISPKTVEKHRASIIRKVGASNPLDLARYALRCGLIDADYLQT